VPGANKEERRGAYPYLIEFGGNKFSTSGIDSFHNYNLKDKKQNRIAKRGR
jgi:hypothetical protein